ncbi:MAG: hypothetical protein SCH70_07155 [Candidatus Methanoperedens sp.]|nr:hypothetical protein [Candidatus Methanoperedens sp.]
MKQLDKNEEEIADILISLGMSRPAATALSYLQGVNKATSADLQN